MATEIGSKVLSASVRVGDPTHTIVVSVVPDEAGTGAADIRIDMALAMRLATGQEIDRARGSRTLVQLATDPASGVSAADTETFRRVLLAVGRAIVIESGCDVQPVAEVKA
jgi:hypothetical protein